MNILFWNVTGIGGRGKGWSYKEIGAREKDADNFEPKIKNSSGFMDRKWCHVKIDNGSGV